MWRKGKAHALLLGMQTRAATLENSMEFPQIELPYDPAILPLSIYPKEAKTRTSKDTCKPRFTAALFTIAKTRKQLGVHHWRQTHTHTHTHTHNGIFFHHKKERNLTICDNTDEP